MTSPLLFNETTLARMVQIEMKRAQYFQQLYEDKEDEAPGWLKFLQRLGLGGNAFYSHKLEYAKYQLATATLREFQRCVVKWSASESTTKDPEVLLMVRLFSSVDVFKDGAFEINKETLGLYNAAVLEVVKFYVIEALIMNEVLRKSNVGTRVERHDIVELLKEHWSAFRMPKK